MWIEIIGFAFFLFLHDEIPFFFFFFVLRLTLNLISFSSRIWLIVNILTWNFGSNNFGNLFSIVWWLASLESGMNYLLPFFIILFFTCFGCIVFRFNLILCVQVLIKCLFRHSPIIWRRLAIGWADLGAKHLPKHVP